MVVSTVPDWLQRRGMSMASITIQYRLLVYIRIRYLVLV